MNDGLSADSRVPVYVRLAQTLRQEIRSERYVPGDILPGERTLASRYNVSQETVRNALRMLRGEAAVALQRGIGYVVREPPATIEVAIGPGDKVDSRLPTDSERLKAGAPEGAPVFVITHADGTQEIHDANSTELVVKPRLTIADP